MSPNSDIPEATIERLPVYLRCLLSAEQAGMPLINSVQLAEMAGTNAAQVRKDLSYLGELGTRGIGYDVDSLLCHLRRWLGIADDRRVAIVGFGRLGSALLGYPGFEERGFRIVAVFDTDQAKVGTRVGDVTVSALEDLEDVVTREAVDVVMLTVPANVAQSVADRVVSAGVRAILNFAPTRLETPPDVAVRQADLSVDLQVLSFHLRQAEGVDDSVVC